MLKKIEKKIKSKILSVETLPTNQFALGVLLDSILSEEELQALEALEAERGWDGANEWLVKVLVSTGKYTQDGALVEAT